MITPAGHGVRSDVLPEMDECKSDLELALREVFERDYFGYADCHSILSGVDVDPAEVQLLVQRYSSYFEGRGVGIFISAAYNSSDKYYFHHSVDAHPSMLGINLPSDNLLYVSVPSGNELGFGAQGVIVSSASTDRWAGSGLGRSGVLIQTAPSGKLFGWSGEGLCVALVKPERYGYAKTQGEIIRHDEISPALRLYCEDLISTCEMGEDAVLDRFGEVPANTIRSDLYRIVGGHPLGWSE